MPNARSGIPLPDLGRSSATIETMAITRPAPGPRIQGPMNAPHREQDTATHVLPVVVLCRVMLVMIIALVVGATR